MPFRVGQKGTLFGKPKSEVIKHPGAETAAAKRHGLSTHEEAERESGSSDPKIRKRGTLALTLSRMSKG